MLKAPAAAKEALKQTTANDSWDWARKDSTNLGLAWALTFLKYSLSLESLVFLKIRMFYASWANFITYLIYNLFICKIFCTGVGRSNEKTDLYIVNYKADGSRWDSVRAGVCRLSAPLLSPSGAQWLCVSGSRLQKSDTKRKHKCWGAARGVPRAGAARLVLRLPSASGGLLSALCFEWVGKDIRFHVSVTRFVFRAGRYKLTTNCVHALHLLLDVELLARGFMGAIGNMWHELLHYIL